jgi:hypothetical protein
MNAEIIDGKRDGATWRRMLPLLASKALRLRNGSQAGVRDNVVSAQMNVID